MNQPRLLHIRSSYFYGGPERQITYLTKALEKKGIKSSVATFAPRQEIIKNRYYTRLQQLNINAHRLDIDSSFDRQPLAVLNDIIASEETNVLIGHDYRADYFVLQLAKKLNLPAISFSRGWTKNTLKVKFYEWLDIRFLKKMDGVVAVSRIKFDELRSKGISPDRLLYIPNSIPTEGAIARQNILRDRFDIPHDAYLLGSAGRLSIEKSQHVLIKAAVKALTLVPEAPVYCLLAGEGPRHKELAALIPDKLKDRIILAGWIEDNDQFYADLDLFVLTSATEGFPNVLLEAGKYSLPAISTPAGGAVEIIEDDHSGLLIPFEDTDALADSILSLYQDRAKAKKLGENLATITREKFGASINAEKFLGFIENVRREHG
ncbi:MAG: glycosyltransferase family 4 protein [FCB group bacterium]|nr:glycosyltransferase family 4 protein [FCB group bacterium]